MMAVDVLLSVENSRRANSAVAPSTIHLGRGSSGQSSCLPHLFRSSLHFPQNTSSRSIMVGDTVTTENIIANQSTVRCVASTGDEYRCTVDEAHPGWAHLVHGHATRADKDESNCFRHALLSSDGTAVITYNEDLILRTFAV